MSELNGYAPAMVGAAVLAYGWYMILRIKREQAKSRETRPAE